MACLGALFLLSACGNTTTPTNGGIDAGVVCQSGQTNCSGHCIDTASDSQNCGLCGKVCPIGQSCNSASCTCPSATPNGCGSGANAFCTSFQTDAGNCGACGKKCVPGQLCVAGSCAQNCSASQTACPTVAPTYCADLTQDANNCGACGTACAAGQQCQNKSCACPMATPNPCGNGANAFCTNLQTDAANCGQCSKACPGGQSCTAGQCGCASPLMACMVNGAAFCADVMNDAGHCGGCNTICTPGAGCKAGMCTCPPSQTLCPSNGNRCTPLAFNEADCGMAGTACMATELCQNMTCVARPATGTLLSGTRYAFGLAVDANNAYVAHNSNGPMITIQPLAGGNPTMLTGLPGNYPTAIAVDATNMYWGDQANNLVKHPIVGGNFTTLATGYQAYNLAVDATNLYFVAGNAVHLVPIGGGTVKDIGANQKSPGAIAADGTNVYWVNGGSCKFGPPPCFGAFNNDGEVIQYTVASGVTAKLASGLTGPKGIGVDAQYVYFGTGNGMNSDTINRVPIGGGGAVTPLFTGANYVRVLAVDPTGVYWADGAGLVWKLPLCGGTPYQIGDSGANGPQVMNVGVSGDHVYWLNFGGGGGTDTVFDNIR